MPLQGGRKGPQVVVFEQRSSGRRQLLQIAGEEPSGKRGRFKQCRQKWGSLPQDSDFCLQLSVVLSIWRSQQQLQLNVFRISLLLPPISVSSATIFLITSTEILELCVPGYQVVSTFLLQMLPDLFRHIWSPGLGLGPHRPPCLRQFRRLSF